MRRCTGSRPEACIAQACPDASLCCARAWIDPDGMANATHMPAAGVLRSHNRAQRCSSGRASAPRMQRAQTDNGQAKRANATCLVSACRHGPRQCRMREHLLTLSGFTTKGRWRGNPKRSCCPHIRGSRIAARQGAPRASLPSPVTQDARAQSSHKLAAPSLPTDLTRGPSGLASRHRAAPERRFPQKPETAFPLYLKRFGAQAACALRPFCTICSQSRFRPALINVGTF